MTIQEFYKTVGGDYEEILHRLMMDSLIERMVMKFPEDDSMTLLREAVADGNIEDSFRAAHTMKGLAANLGFSGLMVVASELTEQLRPRDTAADPKLYEALCKEYDAVIAAIHQYTNEK